MYLVAHTTGTMYETDEVFAIKGKSYEIIDESEVVYIIEDELGDEHALSKMVVREDGVSYKTWFELVEKIGGMKHV